MTAAVMGDAAVAVGDQKHHLGLPAIRVERPAMAEHHGLTRAPVLEIEARAIFRREYAHRLPLSDSVVAWPLPNSSDYSLPGISAFLKHHYDIPNAYRVAAIS
jgi:hypothetical protein